MKNDKKTTREKIDQQKDNKPAKNDRLTNEDRISEKYTDGKDGLAEGVRENNPNRNVDKTDATNAGGYRN